MAKVGAQRAAELTGRSKSTIQRAMNSGKLSYEIDPNDRRVIDVSELERVFGLKPSGAAIEDGVETELKKASDLLEMERLKMRVKMLEDQLEAARDQIEDIKEQRDSWQRQAQQVLLTSQYSQKQAEQLQEELKERDRKEEERRKEALEARMKRLQEQNQNQNRGQQRPAGGQQQPRPDAAKAPARQGPIRKAISADGTASAEAAADASGKSFDIQDLWKKLKGEKGKASAA